MTSFSNFKSTIVQASQTAAGVSSGLDSAAVLSIAESTKGTLTKSFDSNETANITLSSAINISPVVSATKEVVPSDVQTKSTWDVNSTGSNYDLHNSAYDTALSIEDISSSTNQWDISTASFLQSTDIANADTSIQPNGIFFSPQGDKFYLQEVNYSGTTGDQVSEYSLVTPWDVSTKSFVYKYNLTQDERPNGIWFSPDGLHMYIPGDTANAVFEYSLSTAWSLSTVSYVRSKTVAETDLSAVAFSDDGTKMYILGGFDTKNIRAYTLSTPWNVSTAADAGAVSLSAQDSNPQGVFFGDAGTKMYMVGIFTDSVHEYDLSTAWDIGTLSFVQSFSISAQETSPKKLYFSSDGTKFWMAGSTNKAVNEYSIGNTTSVTALTLGSGSFSASDVGKRIVVGGGTAFLTATTGTYVETETITGTTFASGEWEMYGLDIDATNGITPAQYTTSSNLWDLLTANNVTRVADFANMGTSNAYDIHFKPDGTKCFAVGSTMNGVADAVLELNLSTAWDITTASIGSTYSVASNEPTPTGIFFKPDGTQMYICGSNMDRIHQYTLSTAWDITTASYDSKFFSTTGVGETSPNAVYFRSDGAYMFFVGSTAQNVYQYTLATPWDVSTATYFGDKDIGPQETLPNGLFFKSDGTQMYVVGSAGDDVNVYNLSTAWDLTATVTFAGRYQLSGVDVNPEGIYFKEDGSAFYTITRLDPDRITQFSVGSLSTSTYTADYSSAVTNASGRINTTLWDDINSMVPDQSAVNGQIFYAMSTDERTTWTIIDSANDERDIVQNSLGTWQYNSSDSSRVSWVNATINNEFYTLQQAVEITNNRMNFTRLNSLSDSNHIALGDTLDLAIIMKADSVVSTIYSDGITINYSGKILNKLAIPGVDYDYTHVNSTNVLVEALQPGNYKFRIL